MLGGVVSILMVLDTLYGVESLKTTVDIARFYNYNIETHNTSTADGYLLTLHRLPGGEACKDLKGPVLLMHGLLQSSADWLNLGPNYSLGFLLADHCYDVWLGNNRGNPYSRYHTQLRPEQQEFWKFSWHEMGKYDLPAMINLILRMTDAARLLYVGFSQGTTQWLVCQSANPACRTTQTAAAFLLAPIAYLSYSDSAIINSLTPMVSSILGSAEVFGSNGLMTAMTRAMCMSQVNKLRLKCREVLFLLTGYDASKPNKTSVEEMLRVGPASASAQQFIHYSQAIRSGAFRQFDHGIFQNVLVYGTAAPPTYNLNRNEVPIHLYYSDGDWWANEANTALLHNKLSNIVNVYVHPDVDFSHIDWVYNVNNNDNAYKELISEMENYTHKLFNKTINK